MKVLVYGVPKSGTTILAYRVLSALPAPKELIFEPRERRRDLEQEENIVTKEIWRESYGRAGPGWWDRILGRSTPDPNAVLSDYADYEKKIWITRDPRDVVISQFFYQWFGGDRPSRTKFVRALAEVVRKEKSPAAVPFHELIRRFDEGKRNVMRDSPEYLSRVGDFVQSLDDSWFIMRYEAMVDRKFDDLADYLGIALTGEPNLPIPHRRVVRSRRYGSWRDWFTESDVSFWKPRYESYMRSIGYDPEDWRLNNPDHLSPEDGSEYMRRIFVEDDKGRRIPE